MHNLSQWVRPIILLIVACILLITPATSNAKGAQYTGFVGLGQGYAVILKNNGTVWASGVNDKGQLGDGTTTPSQFKWQQVKGLKDVISLSTGESHTLVLKKDGTVWSFGKNDVGQLGDGTRINKAVPVKVLNLEGIIAVSAGGWHSVALKNDGTVWVWGSNMGGQLGDQITAEAADSSVPIKVNLTHVTSISASQWDTLALKKDGTVWTWGSNSVGGVPGELRKDSTPVKIEKLNNVRSIFGGAYQNVIIDKKGKLWARKKHNGTGVPKEIKDLAGSINISSGLDTIIEKKDGTVWIWNTNKWERPGAFEQVELAMTNIVGVMTGWGQFAAIQADGGVWFWDIENPLTKIGNLN